MPIRLLTKIDRIIEIDGETFDYKVRPYRLM